MSQPAMSLSSVRPATARRPRRARSPPTRAGRAPSRAGPGSAPRTRAHGAPGSPRGRRSRWRRSRRSDAWHPSPLGYQCSLPGKPLPAKIEHVVRRARRLGPRAVLIALAWCSSAPSTSRRRRSTSPPWTTPPATPCSPARSRGSWCWSGAATTSCCLRAYGCAPPRPRPGADDDRHDLRHRLADQAVRHDAGRDGARRARRGEARRARSDATCRSSASRRSTQVTIQRLLTHSAGLPGHPADRRGEAGAPRTRVTALARLPFDYPPGSGTQYSDIGFILLGEVVRRVSGQPLDRYLDADDLQAARPARHDVQPGPDASAIASRRPSSPTATCCVGEVHDPRARLLGGVAGHAGMFSTAADLGAPLPHAGGRGRAGRRARAQAGHGAGRCGRAAPTAAAAARSAGTSPPGSRAPCCRSSRSESSSHTGFTGTSRAGSTRAPAATSILLTNRVHPSGGGAAQDPRAAGPRGGGGRRRALRRRRRSPRSRATRRRRRPTTPAEPAVDAARPEPVRTGLDVLAAPELRAAGRLLGRAGDQPDGRRRAGPARRRPAGGGARACGCTAIFSPEHGLSGDANTDVPHGRDAVDRACRSGASTARCGGRRRRCSRTSRCCVFDIQDVGARYYTYLTTLVYVMEEAAQAAHPGRSCSTVRTRSPAATSRGR